MLKYLLMSKAGARSAERDAAGLCIMGDFVMTALTDFDKRLLNLLQGNLPVCSRPFARLGEMLETTEAHVLRRVEYMKN